MNDHKRNKIATAICEFYDVGFDQVAGSARSADVTVARCAIATELQSQGDSPSKIARYLNKTELAVRAMLAQYESRAAAAGLPLYGDQPVGGSAVATRSDDAINIIRLLATHAGADDESEPFRPFRGLPPEIAAAVARQAFEHQCVATNDIREFFRVDWPTVTDWLREPEDEPEPADLPPRKDDDTAPSDPETPELNLDAVDYLVGRMHDAGYVTQRDDGTPMPPAFGAPVGLVVSIALDAQRRGIALPTVAAFFGLTTAKLSASIRSLSPPDQAVIQPESPASTTAVAPAQTTESTNGDALAVSREPTMHAVDIPVFATPAIVPDVMTPAPQPEPADDVPRPARLADAIDFADLRDVAQALLRRYHKVMADDDLNQAFGRILSSLVHAAIDDVEIDSLTLVARDE